MVTLEELRELPCAECGKVNCEDDQIVLASVCHPRAGTDVSLDRSTGVLTVVCSACDKHVLCLQLERPNAERLS